MEGKGAANSGWNEESMEACQFSERLHEQRECLGGRRIRHETGDIGLATTLHTVPVHSTHHIAHTQPSTLSAHLALPTRGTR